MAKKPTLFYIDKKDADKAHGCPLIALDQGRLDIQKDGTPFDECNRFEAPAL